MKNLGSRATVLVTALAALVLAACGGGAGGEDSSAPTPVSVYYTAPLMQYAVATVAEENGLFPDDIDVKVEGGDSTVGMTMASSGRTNFYINVSPITEQIAHGGAPLVWIASWQDSLNGLFIGRNGVTSLEEMKGKTLGIVQPGITLSVLANAALRDAGLESGDYNSVSLGTVPALISAFASGSVDGIVIDRMNATRLLSEVDGAVELYDYTENDEPFNASAISVNSDWLEENPDAAVSFLKGIQAALTLIHEEPEKAADVISKVVGVEKGPQLDAIIQDFIDHSSPELMPIDAQTLEPTMTMLQAEGNDWATPDFASSLIADPSYLEKALKK